MSQPLLLWLVIAVFILVAVVVGAWGTVTLVPSISAFCTETVVATCS